MPHIRLTVDGTVELDGDLGDWQQTPPDFVRDRLRPDVRVKPWEKAAMLTMTDSLLTDVAVDIEVQTGPKGFTLTVKETE